MKYQGYINGRNKLAKVPEKGSSKNLTELQEDELEKPKGYLGI